MKIKTIAITIVGLAVLAVGGIGFAIYWGDQDHTGVALNAPQGNPVVRAVPQDWPAAYKQRVAAKAAYIHDKQKAFDWFAIFPFSAEDGFPLILLKLLPEVAPDIWAGGEAFLSDVGLFHDPRAKNLPLPRGVGFSGIGRGDSSAMDYTSFTCAACHMGRVKGPKGEIIHIDGGVNAEFNINAFFVKLHQTFAALSQGSEGAASKKKITEAFLAALDKVTERSDTYFYENARYGDMVFDATYEQAQIALLRKDAAAHVGAFVDYTENFVAAFTTYLDKTYDNYQPQMLKGLPGYGGCHWCQLLSWLRGIGRVGAGKKARS